MFWFLVRFFQGALNWGLYANPFEKAIPSAVACSEVKMVVCWCCGSWWSAVLVWVVSSSFAVEDGFLFTVDKNFHFSIGQMQLGLLLFPSFFWKLICHFISHNAGVSCIHWRTMQVDWARVLMFHDCEHSHMHTQTHVHDKECVYKGMGDTEFKA